MLQEITPIPALVRRDESNIVAHTDIKLLELQTRCIPAILGTSIQGCNTGQFKAKYFFVIYPT